MHFDTPCRYIVIYYYSLLIRLYDGVTHSYMCVDGAWSAWSAWSDCSHTCGGGHHTRHRACDDPPPTNGGHTCPGSGTLSQPCDTGVPCPGKDTILLF
jgi:hypothetical protein